MNIAIVGCGGIANTHAKALKQLGHTLYAVIDSDISRAKDFQSVWGAKNASDRFEDALVPEVGCVHLCTPPALHYEMAKKVLLAGKNLICEKPLCLESAQAKELYNITREKNLIGAVNFNVRYHEACRRARDRIRHPSFGDIRLIHGSYMQEFHVLPAEYSWRYISDIGGKMRAVTEIGSHWFDLARYWSGLEITEVSAVFGKYNPKRILKGNTMYVTDNGEGGETLTVTSEDSSIILLRFSNGAIGSLVLSEVSHGRSNQIKIEVSGAKQSVWWNNENPYLLNVAHGKFQGVNASVNAFGGGFPDTFSNFFTQIYKAIEQGEDTDYPNFYDGYVNAAICEAIYKSAETNSSWTKVQV